MFFSASAVEFRFLLDCHFAIQSENELNLVVFSFFFVCLFFPCREKSFLSLPC